MRLPLWFRSAAARFIRPLQVRIQSGPNAGKRWSLGASGRYRAGKFEPERMEAIQALLQPGDCVWDVGAHHGYVTLLASQIVGAAGAVYSFEPSPYSFGFLRQHVAWNRCLNVEIFPVGLSDRQGLVSFSDGHSSLTFHVGSGTRQVEVTTLSALLGRGLRPPDFIKMDTEGSEGAILQEGARHLPARSRLLVSVHSEAAYQAVVSALRGAGFTIVESRELVEQRHQAPGQWPLDPDLLAVGPERRDLVDVAKALPFFRT